MIKAIIFDFFGVLVTEGFTQFRETYFAGDQNKYKQSLDLMKQVDSGLISEESFTNQIAELASTSRQKVNELLGDNIPNKYLLDFIRGELKERYKIGMLSNSGDDYPKRLLRREDLDLFNDVLLSYKFGIVKPQLEIYKLAAERLGLTPTDCLFTDDSDGHCSGARQAGMQTITYKDFEQFKTELQEYLN